MSHRHKGVAWIIAKKIEWSKSRVGVGRDPYPTVEGFRSQGLCPLLIPMVKFDLRFCPPPHPATPVKTLPNFLYQFITGDEYLGMLHWRDLVASLYTERRDNNDNHSRQNICCPAGKRQPDQRFQFLSPTHDNPTTYITNTLNTAQHLATQLRPTTHTYKHTHRKCHSLGTSITIGRLLQLTLKISHQLTAIIYTNRRNGKNRKNVTIF